MTKTMSITPVMQETSSVLHIIDSYHGWVDTLAGCMERAAGLLANLFAQQDDVVDQLRKLCSRTHSLRHSDFDAIFGKLLADRGHTRQSLAAMVNEYRSGRDAVIDEAREMFTSDMATAAKAWPDLKQRLLNEPDDGVGDIVAALRQVHMEQETLATALSGLLMRGDRLRVEDLKFVAQKLTAGDSRDSAELAALLQVCESAGRNAAQRWERLAG